MPKLIWKQTCRYDVKNMLINMWRHLPQQFSQNLVGNTALVCLSSANCLQAFLGIIFRRGFFLGRQPCRPIWCSVQCMVWALTGWPPPLQHLQQYWQHSYVYLPNTTSEYDAEHVHSTSLVDHSEACSECTVQPVLLNRCMILATVLQFSFRVLAIFL